MYDDRWTLEQARRMIERGDRLYAVNPSTGDETNLELYDYAIRTKPDESLGYELDDLPDCG
jgi:hypothetical protein